MRRRSVLGLAAAATVTAAVVAASPLVAVVLNGSGQGAAAHAGTVSRPRPPGHWVDTWVSMPQLTEPGNMPPAPFTQGNLVLADATLRQTIHTSVGGRFLRLRFSNAFGGAALPLTRVSVALPLDGRAGVSAIQP